MKIVIVYRHYWPDTAPLAPILKDIAEWLQEDGHNVTVLTAQPSYRSVPGKKKQPQETTVNGVEIRRFSLLEEKSGSWNKAANALLFSLKATVWCLTNRRADLYWSGTTPPVIQSFLISIAAKLKQSRFLYQMQDIHPEIALVAGQMKAGFVTRLLRWADITTLKRSNVVTVLSEDMKASLANRGIDTGKVEILNNHASLSDDAPEKEQRNGPVRFVFAGNIGRFQNLTSLVDAFAMVAPQIAVLEMVGDGTLRRYLEQRVLDDNIENVRFHRQMTATEAFDFSARCDVGVVSLAPEVHRYAYPSKVQTCLAAGLPILAIVEDDSALAEMVLTSRIGASISQSGGAEDIAYTIKGLVKSLAGQPSPSIPVSLYSAAPARQKWQYLLRNPVS